MTYLLFVARIVARPFKIALKPLILKQLSISSNRFESDYQLMIGVFTKPSKYAVSFAIPSFQRVVGAVVTAIFTVETA
jgi:hypothetical protein